MLKYGSDKPDLRNPLVIEDLTEILSKSSFEPFKTSLIRVLLLRILINQTLGISLWKNI